MEIRMKQVDVSVLIRPGVYLLWHKGCVVYVGQSVFPLQRVYWHRFLRRLQRRGRQGKGKVRPIIFDRVTVVPTEVEDLDRVERELIQRYRPEFNILLKGPSIQVDIDELIAYSLPVKTKIEIGKRI